MRPPFTAYTLVVRQDPSNADAFDVNASVSTSDGRLIPLGGRRLTSTPANGFLTRQAILPGPNRYAAPLVEQAPGGRVVSENLCQASCPDVNVRFEDVPLDSVWQVRRGSVDGHFVSGDTEVVTASIAGIDIGRDDIQFTYFPAPYNSLRPYLGPIPGASSLPALVLALLGTVAGGTWLLALGGLEAAVLRFLLRRRRRTPPAIEPVSRTPPGPAGTDRTGSSASERPFAERRH